MDPFGNNTDNNIHGNSSNNDAWGNNGNNDGWGNPPSDVQGNYDPPSDDGGGSILDILGDIFLG